MMIRSFSLALAGALLISGAALAQSNGRGGDGGGSGGGGAGGASDPGSHVGMLLISRTQVPGGPNRQPRGRSGSSAQDVNCFTPQQYGAGFSDNGVARSICPTN